MAIKPILMNTEMVRAIIDGRKTVTRRVVKPQPMIGSTIYPNIDVAGKVCAEIWENGAVKYIKQPYHRGDILWVRETWNRLCFGLCAQIYVYRASEEPPFPKIIPIGCHLTDHFKWRPSINMPRKAARIWLRVTDVRVERLQTSFFEPICPIFAVQAEGIDIGDTCRECIENYGEPCCVDTVDEDGSDLYGGECGELDQSRGEFSDLWDSAIKPADREKYGWAANPWVWRVVFERCEKPEAADDG